MAILGKNSAGKRQALMDALASPPYPSIKDAAIAVGLPYSTATKWNTDAGFHAEWQQLRRENQAALRGQVLEGITAALPDALATKVANLQSKSFMVREQAATWLLEYALGKTPEKQEVQLTASVSQRLDVSGLTDDELDTLERLTSRATRPD